MLQDHVGKMYGAALLRADESVNLHGTCVASSSLHSTAKCVHAADYIDHVKNHMHTMLLSMHYSQPPVS